MRYIFFDCECANCFGGKAKICSFGYVISDTDFNVLQKKDVLIDPKAPFDRHVLGKSKKGITLAYRKEDFYEKEDFAEYFPNLSFLLTQPDVLFFGFSVGSDLHYLNDEYDRYKVKRIEIKAYDIAKIIAALLPSEKGVGVEGLVNHLSIDATGLVPHKSVDDALMSMLILKTLVTSKGLQSSDFLKEDFLIDSAAPSFQPGIAHHRHADNRHLVLVKYPDSIKDNKMFNSLIDVEKESPASEELKGVAYSFSYLCKEDMKETLPLALKILDCGGKVVRGLGQAQFFVVYDEQERSDLRAKNIPHSGSGVQTIFLHDILGKSPSEWPKKEK